MIMTKLEKQSVKPNNPVVPKIHKPGRKIRPIVSNIGAPTHNLAKWLVKRFEKFPKFQTLNIKNSMELLKKLYVKVESDNVLVSFDVTPFIPSMPLEKMLISLEKWLTSVSFSKFEISEYVHLIKLCIFHNAFKLEIVFIYKIMF